MEQYLHFFIIAGIILIFFLIEKILDRIYVSDVYHHCWRLLFIKYQMDKGNGKEVYEGNIYKTYDKVENWICSHNMHYYRCKIEIRYSTISNPLIPGQGDKYKYGISPVSLAANILNDLTHSKEYFEIPDNEFIESRSFFKRLLNSTGTLKY